MVKEAMARSLKETFAIPVRFVKKNPLESAYIVTLGLGGSVIGKEAKVIFDGNDPAHRSAGVIAVVAVAMMLSTLTLHNRDRK